MSRSSILLSVLVVLFPFFQFSVPYAHVPLFQDQHFADEADGRSVEEELLPAFASFVSTEETWCRGGRGRIIGGYQSEPSACATICEEEPSCGGFNLRAIDGICAAYTHGCREDTNVEWTFYRKKPKVEQVEIAVTEPETTSQRSEATTTVIYASSSNGELVESVEQQAQVELETTTEPATSSTMVATTEEVTTTTTEAATTTTTEETTTTTEAMEIITTEAIATVEPQIGDPVVAVINVAARKAGSNKFDDNDNDLTVMATPESIIEVLTSRSPLETIIPALKNAVFGEYQQLKGNCRGGAILKMFVEITPKQCADACSSHCSCVGFTYAEDSQHCVLKESRCEQPYPHHPSVNYFAHIYRHPAGEPSNKSWGY